MPILVIVQGIIQSHDSNLELQMLKNLKKSVSTLMIGAALGTATMTAPTPNANAGILLAPIGIGIILIVVGLLDKSLGLVILSNPDGSISQDSLSSNLMQKYQSLGMDNQTASDLASMIKEKASATQVDANGKVAVNFSKAELSDGLRASNVESDNTALFAQLSQDLQ